VEYPGSVDVSASLIDVPFEDRHRKPRCFQSKGATPDPLGSADRAIGSEMDVAKADKDAAIAVDRVEWDPVVEIHPISAVQQGRVSHVLRTGSPILS
jgi:hypothetical protein